MKLADAITTAEADANVKKLVSGGSFFCSAYVLLSPKEKITMWTLSYYSPKTGKIAPVEVSENDVSIGEEGEPMRDKGFEALGTPHVDEEAALAKAAEKMAEMKITPIKTILSLQKDGIEYWNVTFLTSGGVALNVRIDAHSGEGLIAEQSNLFNFRNPGAAG